MELDPAELDRIAEIARIPLDPRHRDDLAAELEAVLRHFAHLSDAVEPADEAPDGAAGVLRPDEVAEPDPQVLEAIREAFPRRRDDLLEVPRGLG